MGSAGDAGTPTKTSKTPGDKEQPPSSTPIATASLYPDWSNYQGYSPVPPHGFFPAPVASNPQAHPYVWGAQTMMPPYGTPPYVMYPPGAVYAHPSMPPGTHPYSPYYMPSNGNGDAAGAAPSGSEMDGKQNEHGKTSGASANGAASQSGESGSDSESDGSDEGSQNDSPDKRSAGKEDGGQNGVANTASQITNQSLPIVPLQPGAVIGGAAAPTTNLNMGMEYWGSAGSAPISALHGKAPSSAVPGEQWIKDERELKKQKRKQSNRESARRSRMRKQAECEELAQRAEVLRAENNSLRIELDRIKKEYEELLTQNTSLKEKLHKGGDSRPDTDENDKSHPKETEPDVQGD